MENSTLVLEKKRLMKPTSVRQFILLYAAWWLLWIIFQTIVIHRMNISLPLALTDACVSNVLLAIIGYIIINSYRFYAPDSTNYFYGLGYVAALTSLYMLLLQWLLKHLFSGQTEYINFFENSLPVRCMFSFLMIVFMALLSGFQFNMKEREENIKRKDEADLLLRDAELLKLRQQLQPHFLFNSLNSISALAGTQPEQARKMIQQLSDFLRGTLKKEEQLSVELSEELQHLQLYLDIEKVRFGHRLQTELSYEQDHLSMKLPSLLLQPVVENAIKFGLYDTIGEITIRIMTKSSDKALIIQVDNPFDPDTAKAKQGTGFGLNSISKRLYLLYGRNDLLLTEQKKKQFITTLIIPQIA